MNKPTLVVLLAAVAALAIAGVYVAQMRYKYSCASDTQCYPCTRWMNCVSEDFYLRNTVKCRMGGEENFSRIACSCPSGQGTCQTREIRPASGIQAGVWVPGD